MRVDYLKIFALWLFVVANTAQANTMEDFPIPPRTQVWWVTNGTVHNGHEVLIKKFRSQQPINSIAEFYKRTWQTDDDVPGYMQNDTAGWTLISRLTSDYQWVVQIRTSDSGRGSEGFLSAMNLNDTGSTGSFNTSRASRFTESVSGGDLLSSTEAKEPTLARTQLHLYPDKPSRVARQFKAHMASMGWSLQDEFTHQSTEVQRFEKSRRQIDVALVEHSGNKTLLFLNEVIADEN